LQCFISDTIEVGTAGFMRIWTVVGNA